MTTKQYSDHRPFFARLFGRGREFPHVDSASLTSRSDLPRKTFPTRESPARESPDAQKLVPTSGYAGERSFVARGKSQKSLDAQRHEMSIDEVRDLLNRNK